MRKLAQKGGMLWVILTILPIATFVNPLSIKILFLCIQLFGLVMLIRYPKEVFNHQ